MSAERRTMIMELNIDSPEGYEEARKLAQQIAKDHIAENASQRDSNRTFPWDAILALRNVLRNSKESEINTNRKEVIKMADEKKGSCGCGCLPPPEKRPKTTKPEGKKSDKSKK